MRSRLFAAAEARVEHRHFSDWLTEVHARQTIDRATYARAIDVLGCAREGEQGRPEPRDAARLRVLLDDLLARNG